MAGNIAKFSNIKKFGKGDVLIQEGNDSAKELYILLQGAAGLYKNYRLKSEVQVDVLSQGGFYGEMSLFLGKVPEHSLVALADSIVMAVNRKNVFEFFSGQSEMTFSVIEGICKKLDAANIQLDKHALSQTDQSVSKKSSLFPEGHGSYLLKMDNSNEDALYTQKITCPLCGQIFDHLMILTTKLRMERTDKDLRVRYKDIEPMHYEIITCPKCYLSTSADAFPEVSKRMMEDINRKVGPYTLDTHIRTGANRDTYSVFAGFYLAILCASVCFDDYQLTTANLWQKLSRLYQDCEDEKMYLYASEKSLADYLYSYEHFRIPENKMQQLCYIIGDLYSRKNDIDNARNYFYYAKTNRAGSNVMKRQADIRLEEMKELKNKNL